MLQVGPQTISSKIRRAVYLGTLCGSLISSLMEIGSMSRVDPTTWQTLQDRIWTCEQCRHHRRVACNICQQTEAPAREVKLRLVGIAPPYVEGIVQKTQALSATNNSDDNLRTHSSSRLFPARGRTCCPKASS
jgi:hypothetical protein